MCFRGQLSATHFIIVFKKKKVLMEKLILTAEVKVNYHAFWGKNVSSAD